MDLKCESQLSLKPLALSYFTTISHPLKKKKIPSNEIPMSDHRLKCYLQNQGQTNQSFGYGAVYYY